MTAHVKDQVFAHQAHKVGANHAHIIVGAVLAQIGVDGGEALRHGAGAFQRGFVAEHDFQTVLVAPAHGFISDAASAHAAAHDEQVNRMFFHFGFADGYALVRFLNGNHRHNGFSLSH